MVRPILRNLVLVLAAATAACGSAGGADRITVLAAASLTDVFSDLAAAYEAEQSGVEVTLSFAASSNLREQILEGSPADVFASADLRSMEAVAAAGLVIGDPEMFAANLPALVVPSGNPGRVAGLGDLVEPGLLVGVCAEQVPCGALALEVFEEAGMTPSIDTAEPNVRSLLTKVEEGELDAGIVYVTDVLSSTRVEEIPLPEPRPTTRYPIAVLRDAPGAAGAFVAFVLSPRGREILARHGFAAP